MKVSRRHFLGSTAAAVIVGGLKAQGTVIGANNRIRVCTIGFNGQGSSHIKDILALRQEAEYVALCDVDANVRAKGAATVQAAQGKAPKLYQDIRDALRDPGIDAVTIATPNHWHALASVWACEAGKDVYVEKPMSHNFLEGRHVAAAARKHGRIVLHGTQSRSNGTLIRDLRLIREGFIGQIVESRGYVYKNGNRAPIGRGAPGPVPDFLDWDLWQGPAQTQPFQVNTVRKKPGLHVHYDWHYFWEYGNGEIGNQGVHEMDIACWGHHRGLPTGVHSAGARFGMDDAGQTPNTQATTFSYADGSILTFEVRNLGSFEEAEGGNCGNSFFGTKGYYVRGKGFFSYKETKGPREAIPVPAGLPVEKADKFTRWFKAIRSRRPENLPVTPEEAHVSCAHCHLGNLAFRAGRSLAFDPATERFKEAELNRLLTRDYRAGFALG
jgi:predicted dehydrogenase